VTDYLVAFACIFGVNLLPAFGPPTWAVLVFFKLNSDLAAVPLVLGGAVDLDAAGARPVEAADHVQERRLAGAGAAVDDAELARRKRERYIAQGVHGHGCRAVLLRDRLEPDERLSRHRRPAVAPA